MAESIRDFRKHILASPSQASVAPSTISEFRDSILTPTLEQEPIEQTEEQLRADVIEGSGGLPWTQYPGEAIASVLRGAGNTTGLVIRGASGLAEDLTDLVGIDSEILDWMYDKADIAGQAISDVTQEALPVTPGMEESWTRSIGEGVGSAGPAIAATAAAGIPGLMAFGAAAGAGSSEDLVKQLAPDISEEDKRLFARTSALIGAVTEPLGVALRAVKILKRTVKATDGWLAKQILKSATGEALQEGIQEIPDEIARYALARDWNLFDSTLRVGKSAAVGGAVGTIVSSTASAVKIYAQSDFRTKNILRDHSERVEAGQTDPTPSKKVFEEAGFTEEMFEKGGTREERSQLVENIRSAVAETPTPKAEQPEVDWSRTSRELKANELIDASPPPADLPAARKLQDEADIPTSDLLGAGIIPESTKFFISQDREGASYWPTDEVARRMKKARTVPKERLPGLLKRWATKVGHILVRPQEHIPRTDPHFAAANEFFRYRKDIPRHRTDEVNRTLAAIIAPLSQKQYDMMGDYLNVRDQIRSANDGLSLRMGFENVQQAQQTLERIEAEIAENPAVQEAIQARTAVATELVTSLAEAKMIPASASENVEDYFHREVRKFMSAESFGVRAAKGASGVKESKAGFQKARKKGDLSSEEYDYSSDYLTSEFRWMVDAHSKLFGKKIFEDYLVRVYDAAPQLREDAKEKGVTMASLIDKGTQAVWQLKPGNALFRAVAIDEQIADAIMGEEMVVVTPEDLHDVIAIGGPYRQYVFPKEIVAQLNYTEQKAKEAPHPIDRTMVDMMKAWKIWTLLNPKRFIPYSLRNISGDSDVALAGLPSAVTLLPSATKELSRYFHSQDLGISQDIRDARDLGVIDSSLTVQDIPEIGDLKIFERFYDRKFDPRVAPKNIIKRYFDLVKRYSSFREGIMRYAAYKRYLKIIRSGKLKHFGAADANIVRELLKTHGEKVAAAHLARNLLGDYGNLPVVSDYLRSRVMPFFAYQSTIFERYPRLAFNSFKAGSPLKGSAAIAVGGLRLLSVSRLAWLYAGTWVWNNLWFPEEEDELSEGERESPHLTLGRTSDGRIRVFRNFGAFGEFLEWFGVNTLINDWDKVDEGKWTMADLAKEMAFDPINKVVQSIRPDVKGVAESAFGRSTFPDIRQTRFINDRMEHAAGIVGLNDEYRWAKGKVLQAGDRARPNYAQRILTGVLDPGQNALSDTYSWMDQFLKKKGKSRPDFRGNPHTRNMRRAVLADDKEAFKEALGAYLGDGGNGKRLVQSIRNMDPMNRLNPAMEHEFLTDHLNSREAEVVAVGRDHAHKLGVTMMMWAREAWPK